MITKTNNNSSTTREIPPLVNKNDLINRLLESISRHSGHTPEEIRNGSEHKMSHWRKIAMYILVTEYKWTYESAGGVFENKAPHAHISVADIKKKLNTEGQVHLVLPYINQVIFDLEL